MRTPAGQPTVLLPKLVVLEPSHGTRLGGINKDGSGAAHVLGQKSEREKKKRDMEAKSEQTCEQA